MKGLGWPGAIRRGCFTLDLLCRVGPFLGTLQSCSRARPVTLTHDLELTHGPPSRRPRLTLHGPLVARCVQRVEVPCGGASAGSLVSSALFSSLTGRFS